MSEKDDLLREFLVESYENLDRLDSEFVALEEDPGAKEVLSSIFRTIHTIKGTCGFLELARLERVTHAGENLLSALRDGRVVVDDEVTTALLKLVDAVREMLAHIESTGEERSEEYADLVKTLQLLQEGEGAAKPAAAAAPKPPAQEGETAGDAAAAVDAPPPAPAAPEPTAASSAAPPKASEEPQPKAESSISGSNIRVQVEQLDQLMNLAGELVLARNRILQIATTSQDATTIATAQRLNLITTEMQERIMKVRMQPVGVLWSKFPRIVRDMAKQLGKSVKLQMQGKGTELDKTLLEAIKDPLTHLVRNAVDHGIEMPDARAAKGKDEEGVLRLDAYHESGQVNIEIVDDGGGIDVTAIKNKAMSAGLINATEAAEMTDRQAFNLIFHAGLSTAQKVTNLSGRGVGMDVVKTNIEKIGGTIEVLSAPGNGTTFRIKIPLTLAIIPALIVTTASDRYAIPQVSLVELVRLEGEAARTGIEDLHGSPVYRLRGELLPLVFLDEQLGVTGVERVEDPCRNIVVVRAAEQLFGLVVDDINDTEEIVVKPLDQQTKSVPVYAGTTILGDGHVALILDVQGLARRAGVLADEGHERLVQMGDEREGVTRDTTTYLLLRTGGGRRMAVELSDVDRLEEFGRNEIEISGDREVVQYRGEIMPLVRVAPALSHHEDPVDEDEPVHVVVHSRNGHSVGLVVDAITDIVETCEAVERPSRASGIKSSVVIDDVVTDLLDLDYLVGADVVGGVEEVVRSLDDGAESEDECDTGARQFCTFYLDDLFFGVDVMQVQEVMRYQPMTRVPLTSNIVSGLINLRGQTVTALDMRKRLGLDPRGIEVEDGQEADIDDLPMNLVLRTHDGIVSILVDRIGDVLTVQDGVRAQVPSTVRHEVRELLTDVYKLDGSLLLPLDIERLVNVTEHPDAV